ncbi:MAG: hypothetical protein BWX80_02098 [Candidatus Hydrogenedentes bacterium ADurb.Bin101]|nr:MAG: hypothetical protein BWX80_02098 [Candidatus Hydrogenedentes bacterium ADurb.Bin101]
MGCVNDKMFLHTVHLGIFHRHLAVIFPVNHRQAVNPVDGPISGNDTAFKINRPQCIRRGIGVRAHFAAGGTVHFLKEGPRLQAVHHLAAPIGRAKHNHAAEPAVLMARIIAAHQDAAHGVGHEMNLWAVFQI